MQICILGAQWVLRQVWSFNSSNLSQLIPHALFPSAPAQCHDRHCACHSSEMILIQIRMGSPLATPAQIWIIHSSCLVNKHTWSWLVVKFVNGLQLFPWRTTIIDLQWVTNCFLSQIFLSTSASPSALLNILQQIASGWIHSSCRSYIHCQYYIAMPMTSQTNKSWEQNIQDHSSTCLQLGAPSTTSPTHSIRSSWKLDELVASSFEMLLCDLFAPIWVLMTSAWATSLDCKGTKTARPFWSKQFGNWRKNYSDVKTSVGPRFSSPSIVTDFQFGTVWLSLVEIMNPRLWGLGIGGVGHDWSCTWPVVTGFFCMSHCVFVRRTYSFADCRLYI